MGYLWTYSFEHDIFLSVSCRLEEKMRAEGRIIKRDYMSPEDRKWLEMDVEDSVALTDGNYQVPYYENEEWITQFGEKP